MVQNATKSNFFDRLGQALKMHQKNDTPDLLP